MKVAMVSEHASPLAALGGVDAGGQNVHVAALAEALARLGAEESKKLFLQLAAGEHANYPQGVNDNTHFSPRGAELMAALAVEGIREQKLGLAKNLKNK